MAGPPAFQFYPADFLVGTLTLSNACVGAYIRLLCYQWESGGVPNSEPKLAEILHEKRSRTRTIWTQIANKFQQGPDGLWRNMRLEDVRQKQQAHRELQARNGRAGGRAKQAKRLANATAPSPSQNVALRSSYSDLRSSVRTEKNAAERLSPPSQAVETVEKSKTPAKPKVSTLAAMIRDDLLPLAFLDESELLDAAKSRAAALHLAYTGSAIRRALASARAQYHGIDKTEVAHARTERLLATPGHGIRPRLEPPPAEARERLSRLKADLGTQAADLHPARRPRRGPRHGG